MKRIELAIPGVCLLEPKVFEDARGHFYETYSEDVFKGLGIPERFVQDNHSFSRKGVLRGLHYQHGKPQAKLVRVLQGHVFDVAVDIRRGSPTFGKWVGEILTGANRRQMYVPVGFAHGFLVLSETAEFLYKCSDFYAPKEERGIAWNDPKLGIAWPLTGITPLLNPRDAAYPALADARDLPQLP
ncbi:MAG: dTDP-4-dehydrorhamnose 3,5-epimerase [Planctomycetes bacterium]|nr:dTDP-4-dehydrorhamnose 3,5-epimerase [Planctomycetota bacterium]